MKTPDLCILYLHHSDDDLTRHHAELILHLNRGAALLPLAFSSGLGNAFRPVEGEVSNPWASADLLVYNWFRSDRFIRAERYLIVEYDTFCTVPFKEFYSSVWDAPAACARIMDPETDPDWPWFREIERPELYGDSLLGMCPLCGILLSFNALRAIVRLALAPLYTMLFSECRIGTLARTVGIEPALIRPDAEHYISWQPRLPSGPGVWHPVKTRLFSDAETVLLKAEVLSPAA